MNSLVTLFSVTNIRARYFKYSFESREDVCESLKANAKRIKNCCEPSRQQQQQPKTASRRVLGQFDCIRCGRSYVRKDSLQRHINWECGKEPQFQCLFCPQRCKRKAHWLRHIRRQHQEKFDTMEDFLLNYVPRAEFD
ncbi:hypothetical protein TSAR_012279 [Trichomalopsis sarcophagae]|uniref:C2H2-type domain-containing protein n=1 Tax=Trichomalopsis sarcophagae TaxID=543379 RepID=A0A232FNQ7_9HYME|nr:hypothetical protein TSAR_012279 [Trichomalopsis sarcophagae]